jgi:hypothetical protein
MKKHFWLVGMMLMILSITVISCNSTKQVGDTVAQSVVEYISRIPSIKECVEEGVITVDSIELLKLSKSSYTGVLYLAFDEDLYEVPVDVLTDGKMVKWECTDDTGLNNIMRQADVYVLFN